MNNKTMLKIALVVLAVGGLVLGGLYLLDALSWKTVRFTLSSQTESVTIYTKPADDGSEETAKEVANLTETGTVSANRDRALLSATYTHARRIGALPRSADDPTKGLHYRNPEHARKRYITDAELLQRLAVEQRQPDRELFGEEGGYQFGGHGCLRAASRFRISASSPSAISSSVPP